MAMTLNLPPKLESALAVQAGQRGLAPEEIAVEALFREFVAKDEIVPIDDWERRLFAATVDCGISVSNQSLSSDGLYE